MSFGDTGEIYEIIKDEDFTWSHLYFNFACVTEAIKYKNVYSVVYFWHVKIVCAVTNDQNSVCCQGYIHPSTNK